MISAAAPLNCFDPPAPQTAEEWIASANTLGAVIGGAVLRADALANMPALDADAVAADRRARPNAFCSFDRDPQGLRSILQEWARTPISEPFHHITIYTAGAASVGLAVLHNMTAGSPCSSAARFNQTIRPANTPIWSAYHPSCDARNFRRIDSPVRFQRLQTLRYPPASKSHQRVSMAKPGVST